MKTSNATKMNQDPSKKRQPSRKEKQCRREIQLAVEKLFDPYNFTQDTRLHSLVLDRREHWIPIGKLINEKTFPEIHKIAVQFNIPLTNDNLRKDNGNSNDNSNDRETKKSLLSYLESLNNSKCYKISNDKKCIRLSSKCESKLICELRNHFETYFDEKSWCDDDNRYINNVHKLLVMDNENDNSNGDINNNGWFNVCDIGNNLQQDDNFKSICSVDNYRLDLLLESFKTRPLRTYLEWNTNCQKTSVKIANIHSKYNDQLKLIDNKLKENYAKKQKIELEIDKLDGDLRNNQGEVKSKLRKCNNCRNFVSKLNNFENNARKQASAISGFCYEVLDYDNGKFGKSFNTIHRLLSDSSKDGGIKLNEWKTTAQRDLIECERSYDDIRHRTNELEMRLSEFEIEMKQLQKNDKCLRNDQIMLEKQKEEESIDQRKKWQFRRKYIHSQSKKEIRDAIESIIYYSKNSGKCLNSNGMRFEILCLKHEKLLKLKEKYWFEIGKYSWIDICYYSIRYSPLCKLFYAGDEDGENEKELVICAREQVDIGQDLLKRNWIGSNGDRLINNDDLLDLISRNDKFNESSFRLMSYNILADSLFKSDMYPWTSDKIRIWSNRKYKILRKLEEYKPDIICLQEVDRPHYYSFFKPILEKNPNVVNISKNIKHNNNKNSSDKNINKNENNNSNRRMFKIQSKESKKDRYKSNLEPIVEQTQPQEKKEKEKEKETEKENELKKLEYNSMHLGKYETFYVHKTAEYGHRRLHNEPIGNMIGINIKKFKVLEYFEINLVDLHRRCKSNIMKKRYGLSQVGLCVLIQDIFDSNKKLLIGTTHIAAAYKTRDVQIMQMCYFLSQLDAFHSGLTNSSNIPIILCGDFNIEPICGCYQLLTNGRLSIKHKDLQNISSNERLNSIKMPVNTVNSQNMTKTNVKLNDFIQNASLYNSSNNLYNRFQLPFDPPFHGFGTKLYSCYYQCLRKDVEYNRYKHENDSKDEYERTEPFFTNLAESTLKNPDKFIGCLDYIWYKSHSICYEKPGVKQTDNKRIKIGVECFGVLEPISKEMATVEYALPNRFEPSDHIPVMALFAWKDCIAQCQETVESFSHNSNEWCSSSTPLYADTIVKVVKTIDKCIDFIDMYIYPSC